MQNPYHIPDGVRDVLVIGDGMSLAHVARAMVFARRLETLGYNVQFATSAQYLPLAREEGFAPHQVYCVDPELALRKIRRGSHIFNRATLQRYVDSDLELLKRTRPEMIVADMRMSLNISAQLERIPYHNITNAYMTHYCAVRERPPCTFLATRILRGPLERLYPAMKKKTLRYYAANFRWMRKRYGLDDSVDDVFDVIASPHHNYFSDTPEYMPSREGLPERYQYVGPLIWEPRRAQGDQDGLLEKLGEDRDWVYLTMGSTGSKRILTECLDALAALGKKTIASTGMLAPQTSPRLIVGKWVKPSAVLPHCGLVICHGGSGSIYQALSQAIPVIARPTFHDQELNASRLEQMGLGRVLNPLKSCRATLTRAIEGTPWDTLRPNLYAAAIQINRSTQC